jgi:hypothetical protein
MDSLDADVLSMSLHVSTQRVSELSRGNDKRFLVDAVFTLKLLPCCN